MRDYTGMVFNQLTALRYVGKSKDKAESPIWKFKCTCGVEKNMVLSQVKGGRNVSCGCYGKVRRKTANLHHGYKSTSTYVSWCSLKKRCNNKKLKCYKNYGGRGITYCKSWEKFESFLKDMGPKPTSEYTIERIDNDGNYCKENCMWLHKSLQSRNNRGVRRFTINNVTKCIAEWCAYYKVPYHRTWSRIKKGWGIEKALTEKSIREN